MKLGFIFIPTIKAFSHSSPLNHDPGVWSFGNSACMFCTLVYRRREIFSWGGRCEAGKGQEIQNPIIWTISETHLSPLPYFSDATYAVIYSLCPWTCKMVFFPPSSEFWLRDLLLTLEFQMSCVWNPESALKIRLIPLIWSLWLPWEHPHLRICIKPGVQPFRNKTLPSNLNQFNSENVFWGQSLYHAIEIFSL